MAYRYNTIFRSFYVLRFILFTVGGLFFLIIATMNDDPVDYFCLRYYDVSENDLHLAETGHTLSEQEVEICRDEIRTAGWLFYFPMVLFQIHCLITMNQFRQSVENLEYKNKYDEIEDI